MSVSRFYLNCIGFLLVGYAILDRGFAYLGYPPMFVGEACLALGMVMMLVGGLSTRIFSSPITWFVLAFIVWGAGRTFPFLERYGLDAIRDSVVWLYAIYAICIASALLRARAIGMVPRWYGTWAPWFLLLAPLFFLITQKAKDLIPNYPGGGPMIWMKPGDMGVHLAGIAGFMGLGLHHRFIRPGKAISQMKEFGFWMLWGIDVIMAGSRNRGGLMSVLLACVVIMLFKPMGRLNKVILPALLVIFVGLALDIEIPIGGDRAVSVEQIFDNVSSVFFKTDQKQLSGTESWRLQWWKKIEDETLFGEYFWGGRGYGVSLAQVHGFVDATGNRSPHNGHLTILARSGVPGVAIWLAFLACVGIKLLQSYFQMRALGHNTLADLNVWVMAYMLAFMINSSFDVYLEGPQGGIWFWSVMGFTIALVEEQRVLHAEAMAKQRQIVPHAAAPGRMRPHSPGSRRRA